MSRRHWSHPGHYLVDPYTCSWSPNGQDHISPWKFKCQGRGQDQTHWSHLRPGVQSTCLLFGSWQSDHFWLRYSKFHIWPWKFKVKVMAKVKPDGKNIWGLEINRYVCFSFRGNHTVCGWDIANSIFDLENSRSWSRSNRWSHLRPSVQSMCLLFVSWQSDHFWLRYSKFHIWPWKFKVKVTTKINQNLIRWSIGQGQQSCQKWKKSKRLFKRYRVNKNLRPAAAAAAATAAAVYEPVQKHKVIPGIPGWHNNNNNNNNDNNNW